MLDMRFQIALTSDHVADFCRVPFSELGIRRRKNKEESLVKYKSGDMNLRRPNNTYRLTECYDLYSV